MPEPLVRHFDGNAKLADGTATDKLNEIVDAINALNAQLESLRPPLGVAEDTHRHFFFARIISRTSRAETTSPYDGRWRYSWKEVHKQGEKYGGGDSEWVVVSPDLGGREGFVGSSEEELNYDAAYCFEDDIEDINDVGSFVVATSFGMSDGVQQPPESATVSCGLREMLPNMVGQVVQMHIVHRAGQNWEPGSSASQVPRSPAQEDMSEAPPEFWFHKSIDHADNSMNADAYFYDRPTEVQNDGTPIDDVSGTGGPGTEPLDYNYGYVHLTLSTGIKRATVNGVDTVFAYYRPIVLPLWAIRRLGDEWRAPLFILDDECL